MIWLRLAFNFLTILPVAPQPMPRQLAPTRAYFPFVGLVIGGAMAGLDAGLRQGLPVELSSAFVVAALLVVTRGLHFEGLIDACDALFGSYDRERKLQIMKDPHVGAFGVAGGGAALLLTWAAIAAIPEPIRLEVLFLTPALTRWAMVAAMEVFPYARSSGTGSAFQERAHWSHGAAALVTAVAAALLFSGGAGVLMLVAATIVTIAAGRWVTGLLGGLTGDIYGAINEVATIATLTLAVGMHKAASSLFQAPLPLGG